MRELNVVLIKPSKYDQDGRVERFRWGFMPNATLPYMRSMTPSSLNGVPITVRTVDEYVHQDTGYLKLLHSNGDSATLLALVAVQSHQMQRAADLAAYGLAGGCMAVIGGPHPMTCDTRMLQGNGVSFALSEAETVWHSILSDATEGELKPAYGDGQRWSRTLESPVIEPPSQRDLSRYIMPMLGLYPARGCPFSCNFCSVIKIAGRKVRSQPIDTTIKSLVRAKAAGVKLVMFVSDNLNKYDEVVPLLQAMIEEKLDLSFFCQCDTQIARQPELIELLARAGCFQIFLGVESFNRKTLLAARKAQNYPESYAEIVRLCREHRIGTHFSNIIGFPEDTEAGIRQHVEALKAIGPAISSFYVLCPIPGTEQYDDFLRRGLITEQNLDRFDGTCPTWKHPHLSWSDLNRLFRWCYREFYTLGHSLNNLRFLNYGRGKASSKIGASLGFAAFARFSASTGNHPMSGGIGRLKLDHARDYLGLRRAVFGYDRFPLPESLILSAADEAINRVNARAWQLNPI